MKKIIIMLLVACMVVSFAACGGSTGTDKGEAPKEEASEYPEGVADMRVDAEGPYSFTYNGNVIFYLEYQSIKSNSVPFDGTVTAGKYAEMSKDDIVGAELQKSIDDGIVTADMSYREAFCVRLGFESSEEFLDFVGSVFEQMANDPSLEPAE